MSFHRNEQVGTVQDMHSSRSSVARRSTSRRAALAGLGMLGLFLAGCAKDAPQDTFQPAGENARTIDNLQRPVFWIAGVIGVIVFILMGYIMVRYRDRGQSLPEQTHGKMSLELGLTMIPTLIMVGIAVPTMATIFDLAKTSDTECVVNVTGQQWWWEFDYPVQEGCVSGGIKQPIVTSGQMPIPTGTKVLLKIESRDVIHSFWVPKLNGKKDSVPGRTHTLRMEVDEPGIFSGQCAEFCGLSHARMRMEVVGLNQADFDTWATNQLEPYEAPTDPLALTGEATYAAQCSRCHQVDGLKKDDGSLIVSQPELYVVSGAAPNLTNLMTRNTFAGATWDLLTPACRDKVWNASPEEFGALYLKGVTRECLNEAELRDWIRDAPNKKPMYTDPTKLEPSDGKVRGMPALGLNDDQITELIAYLLERK
ncbi:MAG TPA: cytochrome c oxidase subunit II [Ilumatobacteraceae bacterium]|nr:cytochrome c oxidase subunit II [Ilumatobacteraceae bacterium]